jgi:hypothetical protein
MTQVFVLTKVDTWEGNSSLGREGVYPPGTIKNFVRKISRTNFVKLVLETRLRQTVMI